jgi:hypothetical protein
VFDDLSDLSDSPASYLAVLALVALDAVFPVAPSETVLVTGGILIERGVLIAPVFVLAGACGAVLGDSILFHLGSRAGPGLQAKMFSSERARERLGVAERLVHERTWLLIASDFLPGGRTAAMFAAGRPSAPLLPLRRPGRAAVGGGLRAARDRGRVVVRGRLGRVRCVDRRGCRHRGLRRGDLPLPTPVAEPPVADRPRPVAGAGPRARCTRIGYAGGKTVITMGTPNL